ncbi:MAG TPA: GNAT family N-acetyltransferase [Chloroflexia bacterium]|nr:GNAT family N-acetyltransferase [Chloroflexia bacterium]
MQIVPLSAELSLSVARFLAAQRRQEAENSALYWISADVEERLHGWLCNTLNDPDEQVWVALDNGRVAGALGGRSKTLSEKDTRRTYLPVNYSVIPLGLMGIEAGRWPEILPLLWERFKPWFMEQESVKPQVWLPSQHLEAIASWEKLGFSWLLDSAIRPLKLEEYTRASSPPGLQIRQATRRDTPKILPLLLEQLKFHSNLPGDYWVDPSRDLVPLVRREIELFLNAGTDFTYLLAERISDGQLLGYMSATVAQPSLDNINAIFFPPGRGILQVAIVTAEARGQGIGKALLSNLYNWFLRHGTNSISLSYDVRNPLSGPFWRAHNFVPVRRAMTTTLS